MVNAIIAVMNERVRQEQLREQGKFPFTCATPDGLTDPEKLVVLAEEFGEVSRHVAEAIIDPRRLDAHTLYEELIQVAAVAVAWAESIEG